MHFVEEKNKFPDFDSSFARFMVPDIKETIFDLFNLS